MITGSPAQTTPLHEIGHRCLGMDDYPYTAEFPPNPELCTGGIRSEATFPACWDGVNLGGDSNCLWFVTTGMEH